MAMPLEDIKVLDLTRLLPGPFCTLLLADMGADVIKIEETQDRVGAGRDVLTPPGLTPEEEDRRSAYNSVARNKRSLALNLKEPEGKKIFFKLVETADVVVEGFRVGAVKNLGVDYETVSKINPRIVYCSISGYGQTGPYKDLPGHDVNYQAVGGVLANAGDREGRPVHPGTHPGDLVGGALYGALGIMMALWNRNRSGRGQYVDTGMVDGVVSLFNHHFAHYFITGTRLVAHRGAREVDAYETSDGKYLSLIFAEPQYWVNACKAFGREDFLPRQAELRQKGPGREEILGFFRKTIKTKTRDEWFQYLKSQNCMVSPIYDIEEVLEDPHVRFRKMVLDLDHPKQGRVKQVGMPIKLSETPGAFRRFAPILGEHTEEVLKGLGYTPRQIGDLDKAGVVKVNRRKPVMV